MDIVSKPTLVLCFVTRKPGTTFEEFKAYYRDSHFPYVAGLVFKGEHKPLAYTHEYFRRGDGDVSPAFPTGGGENWEYDCVARIVFRNAQHRDATYGQYEQHKEAIFADEEKFLDRSKTKIIFIADDDTIEWK